MFHFVSGSSMPPMFGFGGGMGGMGGIPMMGGMPGMMSMGGPPPADPPGTHTELYDRLGLECDASAEDIRKAHKRLRIKLHPDKPSGDKERFQEVQEAYEVLSNPKLRTIYDKWGKDGVEKMGHMAEPIKRRVDAVHVGVKLRLEEVFAKQSRTIQFKRATFTGHRQVVDVVTERVEIPKGAPDGFRIILREKGHVVRNPRGDEDRGDVVVRVQYDMEGGEEGSGSHVGGPAGGLASGPVGGPAGGQGALHAEGFELMREVSVSFRLALLGGVIKTRGLDDEGRPMDLEVSIPPRLLFQGHRAAADGPDETGRPGATHSIVSVPEQGLPIGSTGSRGGLCLVCTIDLAPLRSMVVSKELHRLLSEELPQPAGEGDLPSGVVQGHGVGTGRGVGRGTGRGVGRGSDEGEEGEFGVLTVSAPLRVTAEAFRAEDARERVNWSKEYFGMDDEDDEDGFPGLGARPVQCRTQ